jgi:hypothetical protein
MDKYELVLEDHDPKIFQSPEGNDPFQFILFIPPNAVEVVRLAADKTRRQLIDIIPGHNHTICVTDNADIEGDMTTIFSNMLVVKLDYISDESRYLTFQFSASEDEDLILH